MEHLRAHYRAPLDPGDENCHNFEFTAPSHGNCLWLPNRIISYSDIHDAWGEATWKCPNCQTVFEVDVPLNSDVEDGMSTRCALT